MSTNITKDLVATFGKSDGGQHDWTYKGLDPSLSPQEIKEACELLTTIDIFEKSGVKLFDTVVTAKIVTHKERLIFDLEHQPEDVLPEGGESAEPTCEETRCFNVAGDGEKSKTISEQTAPLLPTLNQSFPTLKVAQSALPSLPLQDSEERPSSPLKAASSNAPTAKGKNGLLQRLFRRKSRNKEAPSRHGPNG